MINILYNFYRPRVGWESLKVAHSNRTSMNFQQLSKDQQSQLSKIARKVLKTFILLKRFENDDLSSIHIR